MRIPLIAANWKMHKDVGEALHFVEELAPRVANLEGTDVVIAPPFTALEPLNRTHAAGVRYVGRLAGPGRYRTGTRHHIHERRVIRKFLHRFTGQQQRIQPASLPVIEGRGKADKIAEARLHSGNTGVPALQAAQQFIEAKIRERGLTRYLQHCIGTKDL